MTETSRQYVSRLLGYLGSKDPTAVLTSSPQKIASMIRGRGKKMLHKRPAPGTWSVAEIVAHLAETELVMGWRYRSIAEKNGVAIQPFDQEVWEKNGRYSRLTIGDTLAMFALLRKMNIAFLKGLPPKLRNNYGMHAERGKETIRHIMNLEAGHDLNHLMQIEKILNGRP